MITGVVDGQLLCCDENNFTRQRDGGEPSSILQRSIYRRIVPIMIINGIFGNMLIIIVLSGAAFRGIYYIYLKVLAFCHTAVSIFWIPISLRLGYGMASDYASAFYHAHIELVVLNGFAATSVLIMTCLIVERYILVYFPARVRIGNARRTVRTFCWSCFIVSFLISAPLGAMRLVYEHQDEGDVEYSIRDNPIFVQTSAWRMYVWSLEGVTLIVPTAIIVLLNSLTIKRFLQLNAKRRRFNAVSEKFRTANAVETSLLSRNRGYKEEQNLVLLTTVMVIFYIVTMIPAIFMQIFHIRHTSFPYTYQKMRIFSSVAELNNYTMYVFIYLLCSKEFRKEAIRVLRGKCNEPNNDERDQAVGEIEDFSRHGTTVRLTPENTRLNSLSSPSKGDTIAEGKETHPMCVTDVT